MKNEISILVVDDEKRVIDEINEFLEGLKYRVFTASEPEEALTILKNKNIDIVILDIKLPGMSGLQVLKKIKYIKPSTEVIMISGHGDMATVIEAMRLGATDYFQKPFRLVDIDNAITRTKRFIKLTYELKQAKNNISILSQKLLENIGAQLIGNSLKLQHLVSMMSKVAQADNTSVLVLGESGTGKELVAHGIHYLSRRSKNIFYSVNCSAVPESLFESEFFGHKKGAFTGAESDKKGWFEIADKGTLFLDEISDMPLGQQAKLLRILEERKVHKVGSRESKSVDVRIIAASNRNLEKLAEKNKFRLDLYHRLSIFIIEIPPLRERREDIPLLLEHYRKLYAGQMSKPVNFFHENVIKRLNSYDFPGNIRELRNFVEQAVILCEGEELMEEHFKILQKGKIAELPDIDPTPAYYFAEPTSFDFDENEKRVIMAALKKVGENRTRAAELLNITWQALTRRMKKFGIE